MKRAILLLLLISAPVGAHTRSDNGLETANYKYVAVMVVGLDAEARSIGLTRDRIQTRAELRLRSAGLTPGNDFSKNGTALHVNVNVIGDAFSIAVEYKRRVEFTTGNRRYRHVAMAWDSGTTGTHSRTGAVYIMNALDRQLDKFLNAYLKVNQK